MTLFQRLGTHWPFKYSLLVKMYSFLIPKYQGLDESLISSFELSDDSSGSYFRNFITGVCGPNPEDTPYSYKAQARKPHLSYNLA